MEKKELSRLAARLMSCPTAPYHEAGVRAVVETICAEHGLAAQRDGFGNVVIRVGSPRHGRAIAFAAHLDHPGWQVEKQLSPTRWRARFNGSVPPAWFKAGCRVRLLPGATVARLGRPQGPAKCFELISQTPPSQAPEFGVWELKDFVLRGRRIMGRACDDLLGVTAALAALIDLQRTKARVHALGLISRAEEVGFQGALTLAAGRKIPRGTLILSLETSKEIPPIQMGRGVIVRVGDRSSVFSSAATRYVTEVATELAQSRPALPFQRALMSGGTCEATAYQEFGFETAAVCVALGNYHNCAPHGKIAEEFIDLDDLAGMSRLLVATATRMPDYRKLVGRLPQRLHDLLRQARKNLAPQRA
jgi:endoglucanase